MIHAVEKGLELLRPAPEVLWVSAFNVFDDREVPRSARHEIFKLLARSRAKKIISETHPNSVSYNAVKECVDLLEGKTFVVELGLESCDAFIRKWCVNKNLSDDAIVHAVESIHGAGAKCCGNFLIGAPFLTEQESIQSTIFSVERAANIGIDEFAVFPNHVKPHTLVDWLWRRGSYEPPSLWALVETLGRLSYELLNRTTIAWFTPVEHPGAAQGVHPIFGADENRRVAILEGFRRTGKCEMLKPLFEDASDDRLKWKERLQNHDSPLPERLLRNFPLIANDLLGVQWWHVNGALVAEGVSKMWEQCSLNIQYS